MARHRRRHKRYGSVVSVGLGNLPGADLFKGSVRIQDVLIGAGVGVIASALLKGALNQFGGATYAGLKTTVGPALPALSGLAAGAALYFIQKKSESSKGMAAGAIASGLAETVSRFAATATAGNAMFDFSGTVGVNLGGYRGHVGRMGMVINDRSDDGGGIHGMNGLLIADHSDSLAELANVSMGPDNDGIAELVGM